MTSENPIEKASLLLWRPGYYEPEIIPAELVEGTNLSGTYQVELPGLLPGDNITYLYTVEDALGITAASPPQRARVVDMDPPLVKAYSKVWSSLGTLHLPLEQAYLLPQYSHTRLEIYDASPTYVTLSIDDAIICQRERTSSIEVYLNQPVGWHYIKVEVEDSYGHRAEKTIPVYIYDGTIDWYCTVLFSNRSGVYAKMWVDPLCFNFSKAFAVNLLTGEVFELNCTGGEGYYVAELPHTPGLYTVFAAVTDSNGTPYTLGIYNYAYANATPLILEEKLDILDMQSWVNYTAISWNQSESSSVANPSVDIEEVQTLIDAGERVYRPSLWVVVKLKAPFTNQSILFIDFDDPDTASSPDLSLKLTPYNKSWQFTRVAGGYGEASLTLNSSDTLAVKVAGLREHYYLMRVRAFDGIEEDATSWKPIHLYGEIQIPQFRYSLVPAYNVENTTVSLTFDQRSIKLKSSAEVAGLTIYIGVVSTGIYKVEWVRVNSTHWNATLCTPSWGVHAAVICIRDSYGNLYPKAQQPFLVSPRTLLETYALKLYAGWNLISIPLHVELDTSELAAEAWQWNPQTRSYQQVQILHPGKPYWVYVQRDMELSLKAPSMEETVLEIAPGWNLVAVHKPINAEAIAPPSKAYPMVFEWNPETGRYQPTSQLNPGLAYWLYAYEKYAVTVK